MFRFDYISQFSPR